MPTAAELIKKVKAKQKKKKESGGDAADEPKPKRSKTKHDFACDVSGKLSAAAKLGKNSMTGLSCLMVLGLCARVGALESIVCWCYILSTEDEILDCMSETGKEHQKSIEQAKKNSTEYKPEAPIHVMQYAAVLEVLKDNLPNIAEYCDGLLETNYQEAVHEVLYFRKVRCHKKDTTRLLVSFRTGSKAEVLWTTHILPHFVNEKKAEQKFGIAPRSGNERKLLKHLQDAGIIKKSKNKYFSAMDSDDD